MSFCNQCSYYNEKCGLFGKCKFANKRSVSLLTLHIRIKLSKTELEKEVQYLIAGSEPICQSFLRKTVSIS